MRRAVDKHPPGYRSVHISRVHLYFFSAAVRLYSEFGPRIAYITHGYRHTLASLSIFATSLATSSLRFMPRRSTSSFRAWVAASSPVWKESNFRCQAKRVEVSKRETANIRKVSVGHNTRTCVCKVSPTKQNIRHGDATRRFHRGSLVASSQMWSHRHKCGRNVCVYDFTHVASVAPPHPYHQLLYPAQTFLVAMRTILPAKLPL